MYTKVDTDALDNLHAKLQFMSVAISDLWGDKHSIHQGATIWGSTLIMNELVDELGKMKEGGNDEKD